MCTGHSRLSASDIVLFFTFDIVSALFATVSSFCLLTSCPRKQILRRECRETVAGCELLPIVVANTPRRVKDDIASSTRYESSDRTNRRDFAFIARATKRFCVAAFITRRVPFSDIKLRKRAAHVRKSARADFLPGCNDNWIRRK